MTNDDTLRKYLLGELPEEEQHRLEDLLIADPPFYRKLQIAENELTDDYVRGALSGAAKDRFEKYFLLSPERQQKLKNALALQKYVREQTAIEATDSQSGWWQSFLAIFNRPALAFAAVTALFLITITLVWTINENARLRNQLQASNNASNANDQQLAEQLSAERARTRELSDELERARREREVIAQELAELKANLPNSPRTPTFAALTLIPGLERGAGNVKNAVIKPGMTELRLDLALEKNDYPSYRAVVQNLDGQEIWQQDNIRPRGAAALIPLTVPTKILPAGSYRVRLFGTKDASVERVANYYFDLEKR